MKVKQLIEQLQKLDPELFVYCADAEKLNGIHDCFPPETMFTDTEGNVYSQEDLQDPDYEGLETKKIVVL